MKNVVVVGQGMILRAPVRQIVQHRAGVSGQIVYAGSEMIPALSGELMRHAAERVVLLEDEDSFLAELGEHTGGRHPPDAGADYDNVEMFI
nr:hypothetical protein [Bradyrhizobium elkanii]